jgi:hypothetical protein
MPKENVEQLFAVMAMKAPEQGISTTLVAALDPKLAGKSLCIMIDRDSAYEIKDHQMFTLTTASHRRLRSLLWMQIMWRDFGNLVRS